MSDAEVTLAAAGVQWSAVRLGGVSTSGDESVMGLGEIAQGEEQRVDKERVSWGREVAGGQREAAAFHLAWGVHSACE